MKELRKNLKFAWIYAKEQKNKIIAFAFCNAFQVFISIVVPTQCSTKIESDDLRKIANDYTERESITESENFIPILDSPPIIKIHYQLI